MAFDLTNSTYEEWIDFVFDHPVNEFASAWYQGREWEYSCSADVVVQYLTRLFKNPNQLVHKFSMEQIEQGFWFIPSMQGFLRYILSKDVSFSQRKECIESIELLFKELFCTHKQLKLSCYMWWDSVFSYCALDTKNLSNEMNALDQVSQTISNILKFECLSAKESALHGVEHLVEMYNTVRSHEIKRIITKYFDLEQLGINLK